MHACWDATLLVLVQPSPASCATCRGTSDVPRVLALTHRHRHKSPSVRQPFAEISGSIAFSPLWFLSRKLCPIFLCQFKGSLHAVNWTVASTDRAATTPSQTAGHAGEGSLRGSACARSVPNSADLYPMRMLGSTPTTPTIHLPDGGTPSKFAGRGQKGADKDDDPVLVR